MYHALEKSKLGGKKTTLDFATSVVDHYLKQECLISAVPVLSCKLWLLGSLEIRSDYVCVMSVA